MSLPEPLKSTASYFYKYGKPQHLEWLESVLLKDEIYLPNLSELNDDNDGLPKLAMLSEEEMASFLISKLAERNPWLAPEALQWEGLVIRHNVHFHGPAALHPSMVRLLDSQLRDFRIYSMTKRSDSMSMWAMYADNHRGYCLEFKNVGELFQHAKDVAYLDSAEMAIKITDPALTHGYFLFCKTSDWSYEEEVRLVLSRRDPRSKVRIDPNWLTRVILGKSMSEEHRKQIREWCKRRDPELPVADAYYDAVHRAIRIHEH